MAALQVDILTPDQEVFSGEAESVTVPGADGQFQILDMHAPIISTLDSGKIVVKSGGTETVFEAEGGVVEVLNNKIIILAESISQN